MSTRKRAATPRGLDVRQNRRMPRTPSKDLEAALVDAAEAVLVREGPQGVTVRAVAQEARVAPMGVYNRFGNKQGLIDLLLVRGFDELRASISPQDEPDPVERLRLSGERYRRFALDHPHYYALMFGAGTPLAEFAPEVSDRATATFGVLVEHVDAAVRAGVIPQGEDPFELAQQIWGSIHGLVTLELYGQIKTPDAATTYSALLRLLMRGARAGS